jgi:uncharacterized protein
MTATAEDTKEPSMEEILASIRKIIADDKTGDAPAEAAAPEAAEPMAKTPTAQEPVAEPIEDILELTEMVEEAPSPALSVEPEPITEEAPLQVQEPIFDPPPEFPAVSEGDMTMASDNLISEEAASAAASALSNLASTVQIENVTASIPGIAGGRTVEELVEDAVRPFLKEWLDQNLPTIVDRLVQKEIEKISKRV